MDHFSGQISFMQIKNIFLKITNLFSNLSNKCSLILTLRSAQKIILIFHFTNTRCVVGLRPTLARLPVGNETVRCLSASMKQDHTYFHEYYKIIQYFHFIDCRYFCLPAGRKVVIPKYVCTKKYVGKIPIFHGNSFLKFRPNFRSTWPKFRYRPKLISMGLYWSFIKNDNIVLPRSIFGAPFRGPMAGPASY